MDVLHAAAETVRHRAPPGQLGRAQRQLEGLVPLGPLAELLVYLGVDRVAAEDDAPGVVEPGVSAPVPPPLLLMIVTLVTLGMLLLST